MYELLYIEALPRPYLIVGPVPAEPARVVYTLVKKDKSFAEEVLFCLNNPQYDWEADEDACVAC